MYMNGRGIHRKTHELNDKMWDCLLGAVLGASLMICGPFLSWGLLIHRFSWDPPTTTFHIVLFALISLASIAGGWLIYQPWFVASRAVKAHTKAMKAETTKYGRGWAVD